MWLVLCLGGSQSASVGVVAAARACASTTRCITPVPPASLGVCAWMIWPTLRLGGCVSRPLTPARSHGQRTVRWRTRQRGSKSIEWRQPSSRASPRAEPLSSHCAGHCRCGPCGGKRRASISCGSATADGAPSVGAPDGYQTGRAATLSAASPWHRFRTAALLLCRPPSPSSPADPGFVPTVFLLRLRRGGGVRYATVHWQVRRPGKANPKADQHRRSAVCPNPTVGAVSAAPVVACRFRKSRWARPSGRDFTGISSNAAATTWRPDEEDAPPPLRRPQFAQRGRIGGLIMACHGGDGC